MRVPSLRPGTHKLTLTVDTKSALGVLSAQRTIIVEDPAITKLETAYASACKAKSAARMSELSRKLIALRFDKKIRPRQVIAIDKPNGLDTVKPAGFAPTVVWYPEKDYLRVVVNVVDATYAALGDAEARRYTSNVQLYICPSGADRDICTIYLSEDDSNMAAVKTSSSGSYVSLADPKFGGAAVWKRTAKGYSAEVKLPWKTFKGLQDGWSVLPVEAMVFTRQLSGGYYVMSESGDPGNSARSYSLLMRK